MARGTFKKAYLQTKSATPVTILSVTGAGKLVFAGITHVVSGQARMTITIDGVASSLILFSTCQDSGVALRSTTANQLGFEQVLLAAHVPPLNIEFSTSLLIEGYDASGGDNVQFIVFYNEDEAEPMEIANTELASIPDTTGNLRELIQGIFEETRNLSTMNKTTGVETLMKEDGSTPLATRTHTNDGTTWTRPELS